MVSIVTWSLFLSLFISASWAKQKTFKNKSEVPIKNELAVFCDN